MNYRTERSSALIREIFDGNHLARTAEALGITEKSVECMLRRGEPQTLFLFRLLRDAKVSGTLDQALRAMAEEKTQQEKRQPLSRRSIERDEEFLRLVDDEGLTMAEVARRHELSTSRVREIVARARRNRRTPPVQVG